MARKKTKAASEHAISTYTGGTFDVFAPSPDDVNIRDVAVQLARKPRWNGTTTGPVSEVYVVAQHSVLVSCVVQVFQPLIFGKALSNRHFEAVVEGFTHDWAEAYLPDLPRPIKGHPSMAVFVEREDHVYADAIVPFVRRALGLEIPAELSPGVIEADNILLATERRDLHWPNPSKTGVTPLAMKIKPWPIRLAYTRFLERWSELVAFRKTKDPSRLIRQCKRYGVDEERELENAILNLKNHAAGSKR
jgi:hypothetical protein